MISKEFIGAGNAIFTVSNPQGKHYTFKIRKKEKTPYFLSLLTGSDNNSNYTYMGLYIPQNAEVRLTSKSRYNNESTAYRVAKWAIHVIHGNKEMPAGYDIQHEGMCCRCGRRLTTPESINAGIGPECAKMSVNGYFKNNP